jgi:hypothetical protein
VTLWIIVSFYTFDDVSVDLRTQWINHTKPGSSQVALVEFFHFLFAVLGLQYAHKFGVHIVLDFLMRSISAFPAIAMRQKLLPARLAELTRAVHTVPNRSITPRTTLHASIAIVEWSWHTSGKVLNNCYWAEDAAELRGSR